MPTVERFPEPIPVESRCHHCGEQLVAVGERHHGFTIAGIRDLVWEHAGGLRYCARPRRPDPTARPYDDWTASRQYDEALRAKWASEDEEAG